MPQRVEDATARLALPDKDQKFGSLAHRVRRQVHMGTVSVGSQHAALSYIVLVSQLE